MDIAAPGQPCKRQEGRAGGRKPRTPVVVSEELWVLSFATVAPKNLGGYRSGRHRRQRLAMAARWGVGAVDAPTEDSVTVVQ